jgi:putative DNA primase/helicase
MTAAAVALAVDSARKYSPENDTAPAPVPFDVVPIADLAHSPPAPPLFAWDGLVPLEHVTIFGAHGGTGKTILMLMLAVCTAIGRPLFDIPTRRANVAFYSGEDGANRLRFLLHFVCRSLGVAIAELEGRLHLLDAASHDPTLFTEVAPLGQREGRTTGTYDALREFLKANQIGLVIVDNASDVFAGSEIARAQVRGFMRSLAKLARELPAAVILLAHVDKGTSRRERTGTEGYSGSTAWHNSARSRIFMRREDDGSLTIEHQKHNLGPTHAPMRLIWPDGGIPQLDAPLGPVVQGIADRGHERALLRLIAEYSARGEHVSTAIQSRTHAARVLCQEPSYPARLKDQEVFDLLRKAERAGYLERVEIKGANRHPRECWQLTPGGYTFADLTAPTALTALTPEVGAPDALGAEGCADCADFSAGGVGGVARAGVDA